MGSCVCGNRANWDGQHCVRCRIEAAEAERDRYKKALEEIKRFAEEHIRPKIDARYVSNKVKEALEDDA